jgi:hypothetical protein
MKRTARARIDVSPESPRPAAGYLSCQAVKKTRKEFRVPNDMDPFTTFDWDFADRFEDSARHKALQDKPSETGSLMAIVNADSLVHYSLSEELPKDHPVGQLWLETQTDLVASIYLAYGGFFRQALAVLRCWFEIAVHGVFFGGHYGQRTARYEQWRQGARNAPARMQTVAQSLAARPDKLLYLDEAAILARLDPIYSFLSQQTHAQALDVRNLQEGRDNVPRYLRRSYDLWYEKLQQAFDTVCFLYRAFYAHQIGSYFAKAEAEMEQGKQLACSLSAVLPEFAALMLDALQAARRSVARGR